MTSRFDFASRAFRAAIFSSLFWVATAPFANAENGVTDTEILIGSTVNIAGLNPSRSLGAREGAKLYFDKQNRAGGIHGRKIRIQEYDDHYNAREAAENAEKLINADKVFVLFQTYGTAPTKAVSALVRRYKVPLFFPFTGDSVLSYPTDPNIFNIRARYRDEAAAMVDFSLAKGWKEIGLFYQADSSGNDQKAGAEKRLFDQDLKLAAIGAVQPGETQFDTVIDDLMKVQPKVLFVGLLGNTSHLLINRVLEKGKKAVFLCGSPVVTEGFPGNIKDANAEIYVFQSTPLISDSAMPVVRDYLADCKAAGKSPSPTGLESYINAKVLTYALTETGRDLSRESLKKVFETAFHDYDVGGFKMSFSPLSHQGMTTVSVFKAAGDKLVRLK